MKHLIYIFIFTLSSNAFSFERIGSVVEKDTLFNYDNYDRVQYHKLREKEYQILSKRLNSLKINNLSEFIVENIEKIGTEKTASLDIIEKVEKVEKIQEADTTEDKNLQSDDRDINLDIDPLVIQESDIINIIY